MQEDLEGEKRGCVIIPTLQTTALMRGKWICIFMNIILLDDGEGEGKNNTFSKCHVIVIEHLPLLFETQLKVHLLVYSGAFDHISSSWAAIVVTDVDVEIFHYALWLLIYLHLKR